MDERVKKWRDSGKYLPRFMRDFHDQKDTFKALHTRVNVLGHSYAKEVNWTVGQCYVIDIFLWHMARHGYVLRKAREKLPFDDITETNDKAMEEWRDATVIAMGLTPISNDDGTKTPLST